MSRKIARLLGETAVTITNLINQLEERNGFPSHDARFLASNSQLLRRKIADLSLDPDDTTAEELYHALQSRFEKNLVLFETQFAANDLTFEEKIGLAGRLVAENTILPQRWAVKNSAARTLLRQLPPKHLMKALKYRSVDSMLKREKTAEIYLLAKFSEPAIWQKNLARLVSRLDQTDLELRKLVITNLSAEKWVVYDGPKNWVCSSDEVAAAAIWPNPQLKDCSLLVLTLILIEGLDLPLKHRPGHMLSRASGILEWWSEIDHLVAELDGQPISFNLTDLAINSFWHNDFQERHLKHGRKSFWKELISRYESLPPAEVLFDETIKKEIERIKPGVPQPVFELIEDELDG